MPKKLTDRIEELERRVRDLEARPVYVPYYPPVYVPYSVPVNPPWVSPFTVTTTSCGATDELVYMTPYPQ